MEVQGKIWGGQVAVALNRYMDNVISKDLGVEWLLLTAGGTLPLWKI